MTVRSVVMTPELLAAMSRSATRAALLRPRGIVLPVTAVVAAVVVAALFAGDGGGPSLVLLLVVVCVALVVATPVLTLRGTRRALGAAMPVGSTVRVEVRADALHVAAAGGGADTRWPAFAAVRASPAAVVLRHRSSGFLSVLPRAAFTDEDLDRVRAAIAR